jgi:hypothetical protein
MCGAGRKRKKEKVQKNKKTLRHVELSVARGQGGGEDDHSNLRYVGGAEEVGEEGGVSWEVSARHSSVATILPFGMLV